MSEDVRCYVCSRNIFEVVALFGIEYSKGRAMLEMTPYTFTDEVTLDKKDEIVYKYTGHDALENYLYYKEPRVHSRLLNKWSPRVRKWYKNMKSTSDDDRKFDVYTYNDNKSIGIGAYIENGGVLIDDSEVKEIQIEYTYYLCPICQDLYLSATYMFADRSNMVPDREHPKLRSLPCAR